MSEKESVEQLIGKRIQKLRKARGYTQMTFAEKVGISTNYLSDIERGNSSVRLEKLVAIINALDCSADDVFADVIKNGYKIKASKISEDIEKLPNKEKTILCYSGSIFTKQIDYTKLSLQNSGLNFFSLFYFFKKYDILILLAL